MENYTIIQTRWESGKLEYILSRKQPHPYPALLPTSASTEPTSAPAPTFTSQPKTDTNGISSGYIILITLACLFATATCFFIYMRYLRPYFHRPQPSASASSSMVSGLSAPSLYKAPKPARDSGTHIVTIDKPSLLDTSSANPHLRGEPAKKPAKLVRATRSLIEQRHRHRHRRSTSTNSLLMLRPLHRSSNSLALKRLFKPPTEEAEKEPSMGSIESFSDNYQFAIRHRPPLGPLRVVERHQPNLADELEIELDDQMFVIGEFADGWVLSVNISKESDCGMVPRRCLMFPSPSPSP